MPLASCSYQTTHGTVSAVPVNAKSGSMPSRVGSMLRVGSPVADEAGAPGLRRLAPVCCQQNALTLVPPPGALVEQSVCLMPRETKIWCSAASSLAPPSFSCQATHGTGSLPATAAPPTSAGFSAVRSGWMFSEGTLVGGRAVLALGDPGVRGRVEAAGEDVRLAARQVGVRLVPRGPRDRARGAGEVDRRRLGLLRLVEVERAALGDPAAVLERADEDLLRAAGLLLERSPRDAGAPADERAADDVGRRPRPGAGRCRRRGRR